MDDSHLQPGRQWLAGYNFARTQAAALARLYQDELIAKG